MDIIIKTRHESHIPTTIEKLVKTLLSKVPNEHLIGLGAIIIVDQVTFKKHRRSEALYWPKDGKELARIEIGIETIFAGMPRVFFFLPFVVKFMLANALYHEIGHHYLSFTHGTLKIKGEDFADNYRKRMIRQVFWGWRLFLLPFRSLINLLKPCTL